MIKRTIEISQAPAHLTVRLDQLQLEREGRTVRSIPCEDIGVLVVDHAGTTYTHAALSRLVDFEAVVVLCGRDHLPSALLLPIADHSQVVWRVNDQIAVSKPLKKQLWRQLVRAKILAQARNLEPASPPERRLRELARTIRSGDPENAEAQAARVYWSSWLVNVPIAGEHADRAFRRMADGPPPNSMLNYGYAIVRAAIARALVAAGLLPAIGLHHSNRSNAFCLADDLIEPLRPIVDARVRDLLIAGHAELDQPTKAALLELLTLEVEAGGQSGPLMVALHRLVASLVKCLEGASKELEIPVPCNSADTARCGS